jgi:putative ABC transport system permease protein
VRSPARRRLRGGVPPSRLRLQDLGGEALAGLLQRPGRSALTLLGVMLGIGSFVAIVGIAQTASGQIGKQFNVLQATQAYVFDVGAAQSSAPTVDFPPDADALADRIHGVTAAGVYWAVRFKQAAMSAYASGFLASQRALPVTAASPGLLAACTGGPTGSRGGAAGRRALSPAHRFIGWHVIIISGAGGGGRI